MSLPESVCTKLGQQDAEELRADINRVECHLRQPWKKTAINLSVFRCFLLYLYTFMYWNYIYKDILLSFTYICMEFLGYKRSILQVFRVGE